MDKKRVFVAIDIAEAARAAVTEHIATLRKLHPEVRVKWVSDENLHITLRFVGDVDVGSLKELEDRVHEAAFGHEDFELTLAETGNFGRRRDRTDTLWIGVKSVRETLREIAAALEDAHNRKFVPHLTIARIKDASHARPLIEAHLSAGFQLVSFIVRDLVIYESTLTPTGSVYSVLSRHSLKAT